MAELEPGSSPPSRSAGMSFVVFTLAAFAITWAVWLPRALASRGDIDGELFLVLGSVWTYGPAAAAVVAAAWAGGRDALRELGSRLGRWRVGWRWYAAVVGIPALWVVATVAIARLAGADATVALPEAGVLGLAITMVALTVTDGLGEEVGWRGWALPRLLERMRALDASLLLGIVWAAWHLPLHFTLGSYLADTPVWVLFAQLPATAIVFTWVFLRTRGSTFIAVLLHGAMNAGAGLVTPGPATHAAGVAAHWIAAVVVVAVSGRDLDRRTTGQAALGSAGHATSV
jgi:uncharacterized protein